MFSSGRSYAVRVTGPARLAGKYERMGAYGEMPLYKGENGQKMFFDQGLAKNFVGGGATCIV